MVDMQLTNTKLTGRAERIIMDELKVTSATAQKLLNQHKNVREAIKAYKK
jgi:N-acetylmuramic acid 6-phosphate etherase